MPSVLVTVTGPDRPGIMAELFAAIAPLDATLLDLEQVTIRELLVLGALVETSAPLEHIRSATQRLTDAGLEVSVTEGAEAPPSTPGGRRRHHVTLLAETLPLESVAALAASITRAGANVESISRLARYPVTCIEMVAAGGDADALRSGLAAAASEAGVDVAVQPADLYRRAKRLIVMDVDSTLVQGEVIEMLAAHAGVEAEVADLTARAMKGELDFAQSLRARVALLEGLPASVFDAVRRDVRLTPGARTLIRTLKRLGYAVGVVSGGFTQITDQLAEELGLDHAAANTLEVRDGVLTGLIEGPIVDRAGKADALRRFAAAEDIPLAQTVAVGDGANDLDMLAAAGLGIAFNAKPVVRSAADTAVNVPYLDTVLFILGIRREDIEDADAVSEG